MAKKLIRWFTYTILFALLPIAISLMLRFVFTSNIRQYTFKITSTDGKSPTFLLGTPGAFMVQLVESVGNDYFYKVIAIGQSGQQSGVYINGGSRLLVLTISQSAQQPALPVGVKSDTTLPFTLASGKTYVIKLTSHSQPILVAGSSSFKIKLQKLSGQDWYFSATAIGKQGNSCGFYVNGSKIPMTVATIL